MTDIIQNQEVLIYIVDADSKQLIRRNFKYNICTSEVGGPDYISHVIFGGSMIEKRNVINFNQEPINFDFDEDQIAEFGYDHNSITGDIIKASYDPELDAYLYPSVAIIYMSKLK